MLLQVLRIQTTQESTIAKIGATIGIGSLGVDIVFIHLYFACVQSHRRGARSHAGGARNNVDHAFLPRKQAGSDTPRLPEAVNA